LETHVAGTSISATTRSSTGFAARAT
jgi:hypothetical protein